ncbi:MAG TPA: hypothetical protein VHV55_20895 [Pirellulales bacterium]|jgi:hypothetical protein|nr:hypothetical protein [Pirellulales bacterium]
MWRKSLLVIAIVAVVGACFIPTSEYTFEFDGVNLRMRECVRTRSWLFGFLLSERCSPPQEHPTAVRLRELAVLAPVQDAESQWLLVKGFRSGWRGWKGDGALYVRYLGASTVATPVPFPAEETLSDNIWVKWALNDPKAAADFWSDFQTVAKTSRKGGYMLMAGDQYLKDHKLKVDGPELIKFCHSWIQP